MDCGFAQLQRELNSASTLAEKTDRLHRTTAQLIDNHARDIAELACNCLKAAGRLRNTLLVARCQEVLTYCCYRLGRYDEAVAYAQQVRGYYEKTGDSHKAAIMRAELGFYHAVAGEFLEAWNCYRHCLKIFAQYDDQQRLGIVYTRIGVLAALLIDVPTALTNLHKAIAILRKVGDRRNEGVALNHIAFTYYQSENYSDALRYYRQALNIFVESGDEFQEANVLHYMALNESLFGKQQHGVVDLTEPLRKLRRALAIMESRESFPAIAEVLLDFGALYREAGRYKKALTYFRRAEELIGPGFPTCLEAANLRLQMGKTFRLMRKVDEAIPLLEEAYALGMKIDQDNAGFRVGAELSEAYREQGDVQKAYAYLRIYNAKRDIIQSVQRQRAATALQIKSEIEQIEAAMEDYRRQSRELQTTIEEQKKEITTISMHLTQKSEFLSKMQQQLKVALKAGPESTRTMLRELLTDMRSIEVSEEDWNVFERAIQNGSSEEMQGLTVKYPHLTPTEIKVCYFIKLDLSSKEIAKLLCSSVRSIETYRYNVRKKLRLPRTTNLSSHLSAM